MYWGNGEQAYVTPVGPNEVGVALLGRADLGFGELEVRFPRLQARLIDAEGSSELRGASTGTKRLSRVTQGNVALVGDASAAIDAISGDGLALAFRQSVLLGEALRRNDLCYYEQHHRKICFMPFSIARLLLMMHHHERLRDASLSVLSAHPEVFRRLLAAHIGERITAATALDVGALSIGLLAEAATTCFRSFAR